MCPCCGFTFALGSSAATVFPKHPVDGGLHPKIIGHLNRIQEDALMLGRIAAWDAFNSA